MQLKGFRRAVLSLFCAANCLNNCSSGRRFFLCMYSQSYHNHANQKVSGNVHTKEVAASNSLKVLGAPKLVHNMEDFNTSWVTQTEDANYDVNN